MFGYYDTSQNCLRLSQQKMLVNVVSYCIVTPQSVLLTKKDMFNVLQTVLFIMEN